MKILFKYISLLIILALIFTPVFNPFAFAQSEEAEVVEEETTQVAPIEPLPSPEVSASPTPEPSISPEINEEINNEDLNPANSSNEATCIPSEIESNDNLPENKVLPSEEISKKQNCPEDIPEKPQELSTNETSEVSSSAQLASETNLEPTEELASQIQTPKPTPQISEVSPNNTTIQTEDAISEANNTTLVNTTTLDSQLSIDFLNQEDLLEINNFYKLWNDFILGKSNSTPIPTLIENTNNAQVEVNTTATSLTGENQTNSESSKESVIQTGDAIASANSVTFANTTLLNSNFLFMIINIYDTYTGDFIFPSIDFFPTQNNQAPATGNILLSNEANVQNSTVAQASSGLNEQSGSLTSTIIETGDAKAVANSQTFVNKTDISSNYLSLIVNNLGSWQGNIQNFLQPGSVQSPIELLNVFQFQAGDAQDSFMSPNLLIEIFNNALVNISTTATANSGQNTINSEGTSATQTGDAKAVANSLAFVNSLFINSNYFVTVINLFDDWQGDIVFAYPDLSISITDNAESLNSDQEGSYIITLTNNGFAPVDSANLTVNFSDKVTTSGNQIGEVNNIEPGETRTFNISFKTNSSLPSNEQIQTSVLVTSSVPEESLENNQSSDTTTISINSNPENEEESVLNNLILNINSSTTTSLGETLPVEIEITNTNNQDVSNTFLELGLINESTNQLMGTHRVDIGTLVGKETVLVDFGITIPTKALPGNYLLSGRAVANANNKNLISNNSIHRFKVRSGNLPTIVMSSNFKKPLAGNLNVLGDSFEPQNLQTINMIPRNTNLFMTILLIILGLLAALFVLYYRKRLLYR